MIKTTLAWTAAGMLIAVVALFFINGGGIRSIVNTAGSISSLRDLIFSATSPLSSFQLPGQEGVTNSLGFDVNTDDYSAGSESTGSVGTLSVSLESGNASSENPRDEHLRLFAASTNAASIDVSGWSIVSVSRGTRLVIPLASPLFVPGSPTRVEGVSLAPGGTITLTSGISPVGVSYRENLCTDLLGDMPTYSACVKNRQSEEGFFLESWRLYGGYTKELWRESDTLRLIDGKGRVVDEVRY